MSNSTTEQEVREMARLSLLTNKINEIQEKNLKMFPLVCFDGVKSGKIEYNLSNDQMVDSEEDKKNVEISYKIHKADTSHLHVNYFLTIDENVDNNNMEKRCQGLESFVRNLLWKEIKVQITINGKLKFESKNV